MDTTFWLALLGIIWVDLLLSGDNAVVIALVCRQLPPKQQRIGMILGAGTAVGLRIIFSFFIATLMALPGLSIVGALLLLWIAINLAASPDAGEPGAKPTATLFGAIITIAIADASMSLDNVMALAALSHGNIALMAFGVGLSIPLVIGGSAIISVVIDKYPIVKWAGAGLLGWVAGGILAGDTIVKEFLSKVDPELLHWTFSLTGAAIVLLGGFLAEMWRKRQQRPKEAR